MINKKRKASVPKKKSRQENNRQLEDLFYDQILKENLPEPEKEYRFHEKRRWRCDYAWPDFKILVEVQGGTYNGGRHVQGKGYANDREKANIAQEMGWDIFEYDSTMIRKELAIAQIARIIRQRALGTTYSLGNVGIGNDSLSAFRRKPRKKTKRQTTIRDLEGSI